MSKACTSGNPCKYRYLGTGTIGYGCNFTFYCDYQLPKDSRSLEPIKNHCPYKAQCKDCGYLGGGGNCRLGYKQ